MPKPVCGSCCVEMKATRGGVVVQLNARAAGGPYQQWLGDRYECGSCGTVIVTAFGGGPVWRDGEPGPARLKADYIVEEPRYGVEKDKQT